VALQIPEKAIDGAAPGDVVTTDLVIALKGTGRHFIASYRGDFDDDGRLIGYFVIHQEVSELKELANKLTASETRARLVMDHVPVEIAHLDAELRVDLANHRLCRLLEVELDQIVGKTITEVFGRRFHTNNATAINDALKGIPSHFEQVLDPRSGRIYDMTYTPDIDQFGRIIGVYAMSYEITALKKAQSSLATSERRLR
jgi:PAS domain S-box-containing protein